MNILCISDIESPVVYSKEIYSRFKRIDLVLSSGDLDLNYYEYIVSVLNKPLLFVFGNHNLEYLENLTKKKYINFVEDQNNKYNFGSIHLGDKVKRVKGLILAGLGGSMRYNKGLNQFTDFQMFMKICKLIPKMLIYRILFGRFLDILVTHSPPLGVHDQKDLCHTGFKSFLWFMKVFKPKYLIHGHIHIYENTKERITKYFRTKVVNAYNYYVLNVKV